MKRMIGIGDELLCDTIVSHYFELILVEHDQNFHNEKGSVDNTF